MSTQVRYKDIYRALMRDIAEGVFSGGEKLPTELALAERFGVTRQTLLKALNIMKLEGTLRSEQGRGTFVNAPAAPRPASGLRQLVYIASNLQESLAHRALVGVESAAHRHGFSLVTCNTRNDAEREAEYLRRARSGGAAGIILIPYFQRNRELALRIAAELPLVCLDNSFATDAIPLVASDNFRASYEATRRLIGLGHRRIGFLLTTLEAAREVDSVRNRFEGYRQALADAKLEFDPALISELGPALSHMRPSDVGLELFSYPAMNRLLHLPCPPTAVLLLWDELAPGAIAAIRDTRREVPRDVSLVGFNDDELCTLITPRLSTVRQDGEAMGEAAVRLLAERINRNTPIPPRTLVPSRFINRDTTASLTK